LQPTAVTDPRRGAGGGRILVRDVRARRFALTTVLGLLVGWRLVLGARAARAEPPSEPPPLERTTPTVTVEAVRPEPLPEDPTSFTRVIEVDRYEGENQSVDDLVERVPGVQVRRFGGPGEPSELSIRGSSPQEVVVLLDGVRLNSAQSGSVDLSTIPSELIDRIEVSRGGGSVQTGSDAIGGVVNVITKHPSAQPHTSLFVAGGSWDTWQWGGTQSGRLGPAELMIGYDGFRTDGDWKFQPLQSNIPDPVGSIERINNQNEQQAGLFGLGAELSEHVRVDVRDSLFYGDAGVPGLELPAGGETRGQSDSATRRRTRNVASLRFAGTDLAPLSLDADLLLFHRYDRVHFRDPSPPPPDETPVDSDDRNSSLGARGGVQIEFGPAWSTQRASLGIEGRRDALVAKAAEDHDRNVVGVFLQDDMRFWDRLRIVPGLRFDDTQGFGSEWIPRVGISLDVLPWLRLQGNAERSYRVPNFDELYLDEDFLRGNPNLEPEDAIDLDLGARAALATLGPLRDVFVEAVGFRNDVDNTIVFETIDQVVVAQNIPNALLYGVELSAGGGLRWLAIDGSWTYLHTEVQSTGGPLPGRPKYEAHLRAELAPFDGALALVGELQYRDEIPLNRGGRAFVSSATVYDATLIWRATRTRWIGERLPWLSDLTLSLICANVTDQSVRDAQGFPQPGRSFTLRAELRR
jgi:outer membrane cobalamin receptor